MITISWDERSHTIRDVDPEDSWDRGDTRTDVSNVTAKYSDEQAPEYNDWGNNHRVDLDVVPGDVVFATMVQYNTGDTFGHSAGGETEVLGVFKDYKDAISLQIMAENFERSPKDPKIEYNKFQFEFQGRMIHVGWTGYFESLDSVWVATLTVQA